MGLLVGRISIHAPLAGCDVAVGQPPVVGIAISIHAPLAGCDVRKRRTSGGKIISIHAPLAGCDVLVGVGLLVGRISIHAPLAGCDWVTKSILIYRKYFNPRTPCGVRRLQARRSADLAEDFNPRTPCGVRPGGIDDLVFLWIFQSTHPLRGATVPRLSAQELRRISIHAPLAGCDRITAFASGDRIDFNPRTPCGVRQEDMPC